MKTFFKLIPFAKKEIINRILIFSDAILINYVLSKSGKAFFFGISTSNCVNQCLLLLVISSYLLPFRVKHFRTIKMDPKIIYFTHYVRYS